MVLNAGRKTGISPTSGVPLLDSDILSNHGIYLFNQGETIFIGPSGDSTTNKFPVISGQNYHLVVRHPNEIYVQSILNSGQALSWLIY